VDTRMWQRVAWHNLQISTIEPSENLYQSTLRHIRKDNFVSGISQDVQLFQVQSLQLIHNGDIVRVCTNNILQ
jgi:hypothetical protein